MTSDDKPPTAATDLPIVDSHHHLWQPEQGRQPWLRPGERIPFRYGDYSALKRSFMPADYRRVTAAWNIVANVTMETEWDEADLLAETAWHETVAAEHAMPVAHVARTILHAPGAETELAAHARSPLVRGIRHKPVAAPRPDAIEPGRPGSMSDSAWRRGYRALAANGLHFELQAPWWHVDELLDLAAAHPETAIVIDHTFLPADRSPEGLAGWRDAIRRAAGVPGLSIKISGLGIPGRPWAIADNRAIIRETIEAFGPRRCMFASNFPVDGLCGSFDTIYRGFIEATADFARADRLRLFHDNAVRVYRLERAMLAD
jgi:predicted TIM-barrel fold metal-dependent hydrolase